MRKDYLKKLLIIAIPIMLSNVISQLQMIIDRIFLGKMDKYYMSVLGNVTSPMWTTMSFCFSLVMGASILISQKVGAGDEKDVKTYAASMVKWNNVIPFALFFFWFFLGEQIFTLIGVSKNLMPMCLTYMKYFAPCFLILGIESSFSVIMQTSNYTKPLIFYGIVRSGLNILLDWLLIFGHWGFPRMEIKGAAIATTIAEFAGCFFAFLVVATKKQVKTKPSLKQVLRAPLKPYISSIKLGINVALEDFAWNFGNLIVIRILNSINELAAGIYSIVFSVEVLIVVIIGSIGSGTMTLTSEAKGCGDLHQYKGICKIAYTLSALVTLLSICVSLAIPEQILSLFSSDPEIITGCGIYLFLVCLNLFGKSGNIIIGNGIRGSGNTKWMFGTQILGTFLVIGSASLFVFVFHWGIVGVFVAVILDEGLRALINFGKFIKITKNWKQQKLHIAA